MNINFQTKNFGLIQTSGKNLLFFRDGVIGLKGVNKYVLLESLNSPLIMWLQAVERPEVAFPVVEPWFFKTDYQLTMNLSDRIALGLDDKDLVKPFVILTIPKEVKRMTANLKAPIVINSYKSMGAQVIMQDKNLQVKYPAHGAMMKAFSNFKIKQSVEKSTSQKGVWSAVDLMADNKV